uniref:Double-stranded RNA-specific editase 1 n=1 Tax=Lygus hesperus TaxID=30085 RepID=A0A0A9ZAC4_LYGHE
MSGRGRFNTRSNQGYNQNKSTYNTRNSYSSPAYSTPTGGYQKDQQQQQHHTPTHQQYHHEPPQQQQQAPPPQQHVPPPQQQKPEPPPVQPVTPKVQPQVQVAPPQATPKPEANVQPENDVKMSEEDEAGKKLVGRGWLKRRGPEFKIPRRVRKRRQNARLKSILAPKNAMMVLHELHPDLKQTVKEINNAANQQSYNCEIEIDGETFVGMGMSKMIAKQGASEAALKAVLLKKLEENNLKGANAPANKMEGGWEEDVNMTDVSDTKSATPSESGDQNGAAPKNYNIPEDDVPWGSLASFALYKLFAEWQSQGFQLPPVTGLQGVPPPKANAPVATPMKKLPEDAHLKHPVQLLNQIRPGIQYIEHKREGAPPNLTFSFSIVVDDLTFKGTGTNKKEAKKLCAKHALEHLGVVYTDESPA